MRKSFLILVCLISLYSKVAVGQQTLTVTNFNDSGAGSLRAAISQYIGVGPKTIVFDPSVFNNSSNIITITSSLNIGYFGVDNNTPLIIDGSTGLTSGTHVKITYPTASATNQGTFIFNANKIVLTGLDIYGNAGADGIFINAGTSTITNSFIHDNAGNGIYDAGFNNLVISNNYIFSNGKGVPSSAANYFSYVSGIRIELPASSGIVISGNTIGTNISNTTGLGNGFEGITIYGGSNVIVKNNTIVGNGNLNTFVPGGGGIGIRNYTGTVGTNTITGNRIGIDNSGSLNGNWNAGISLEQTNGNIIGSALSSDGNLIYATKNGPGIVITQGSQAIGGANNNILLNNVIGNPISSVSGYSNKGGISISASSKNNTIGSLLAPNTIANNTNFAIQIDGAGSTGNRILANSTFCNNNNKGIALVNNGNATYASGGTTPPNLYINSADLTPGQISGVSPANAVIDVYIQSPCESCGSLPATNYAQGKTWVGATTANSSGAWTYTLSGLATKTNTVVTATDASNNTSEFSACYGVVTCTTPSALFTISTASTICSNANLATLTISGAQASVAYVPTLNGTTTITGSTVTASGTSFVMTIPGLALGNNAIRIIAYNNCASTISGLVTITVNSSPNVGIAASGSTICPPQISGTVSISGQNGVSYSAYVGNTLVGGPILGNGGSTIITISSSGLSFGNNTVSVTAFIAGCPIVTTTSANVRLNPSISATTLLGSTVCSTTAGTITIGTTQSLVTYIPVLNGNTLFGSSFTATGSNYVQVISGLTSGVNTVGILASTLGCSSQLLGTTTIVNNSISTLTAATSAPNCGAVSAITVTLTGVATGNTYTAYINGSSVASGTAASSTLLLSIGTANLGIGNNAVSITGFVAGCGITSFGTTNVVRNPVISTTNSVSGSTICLGSNGSVTVSNPQAGVWYYLTTIGGLAISPAVTGSGTNLAFSINASILTSATTYTIGVQASVTGCTPQSLTNASIVVNTNPTNFTVGNFTICPPAANAFITLSGSVNGNTYTPLLSGTPVGSSVVGNGSSITLTIPATNLNAGSNTIQVSTSVAGCGSALLATMGTVLNNPTINTGLGINFPSLVCENSTATIAVSGAQSGVTYYPIVNGVNGTPVSGTGTISLVTNNLSVGTTTVFIGASVSGCTPTQLGAFATIVVRPDPLLNLAVSGAAVCGTGTNGTVTVSGSQIGVDYQVVVNGSSVGTAVAGTGSDIILSIPSGNLSIGLNTISVSGTGCHTGILSDTAIVNVNNVNINTTISGTASSLCGGNSATFNAVTLPGINSYNWSVTGGGTVTSGNGTPTATIQFGTTTGVVSLIPTGGCGNGSANTLTITVTNAPEITSSIDGPTTLCQGSNATYSIAGVANATSFGWNVSGGLTINSGQGTQSINVALTGGTGTITLTANGTCGNSQPVTLTVASTPLPSAAGAISGNTPVCANSTNTYTISGVANASSYDWTLPSGTVVTTTTPDITFTVDGIGGTLSVIPRNSCGTGTGSNLSIAISSVTGTGNAVTDNGSGTACANSTGNPFSTTSVSGAISYIWNLSNATITGPANGTSISVSVGASGTAQLSVAPVFTCGTGQYGPILTVTLTGSPDLGGGVLTGNTVTCSNFNTSVYTLNGAVGAVSYLWSGFGITTVTSSNQVDFGQVSGNGTVNVSAIGQCGTTAWASPLSVSVQDKPSGYIDSPSQPVCYSISTTTDFTVVLSGNVRQPVSYDWGSLSTTTGNSITLSNGNLPSAITVSVNNICGFAVLSTSSSLVVDTLSKQTLGSITGSNLVCTSAQSKLFSVASLTGASYYQWGYPATVSIPGALVPMTTVSYTNGNPVSFDFGSSSATLTLTAFSANGCQTASKTISVSIVGTVSGIVGNPSVCSTNTDNLYYITTVPGATGYSWTVGNGTYAPPLSALDSIRVTFTSSGIIQVYPKANDEICTVGGYSLSVTFYTPLGTGQGIIGLDTACRFQSNDYLSTVSGALFYHWNVPPGASITPYNADSSRIKVTFGSVSGVVMVQAYSPCLQALAEPPVTKPVTVLSYPTADAGGTLDAATGIKTYGPITDEQPISLNGSASSQTTATSGLPKYTYTWTASPSTVFTNGGTLAPGIGPTERETKVYLTVGNGYCSSRDSALVKLDIDLIPKAFSPNGDGTNDTWQIDNLYTYRNFKLTVFNKWGSPVKEFSSYDRDRDRMWDGKSNGVDLPVAVYYYIIDFNGENGKQPRKGTVTIVR